MKVIFPLFLVLLGLTIISGCAHNTKHEKLSYSKSLDELTYPYEVKKHEISFMKQKLSMAYMDVAPRGEKRGTVVLFHGKNFNGLYWGRTARDLSKIGFRVVIPDQIGFGKSDKPLDYEYSFHGLAHNTLTLLDHLGVENVSVVGHSMGGMLATRFALMYPKRVEKLALINPIGLEDWKRVVPYTPLQKRFMNIKNQTREDIINYQKTSYYDGKWKPKYEKTAGHLIGWAQGPDSEHMAWISALTYEMVFTQPVVYEFDVLKPKTLLVLGTRDRTALGKNLVSKNIRKTLGRYDKLGEKTCAKIPRCELKEIRGVGHLPQVEAYPTYFKYLSGFLLN